MICPKCGREISPQVAFCPYCGVNQESQSDAPEEYINYEGLYKKETSLSVRRRSFAVMVVITVVLMIGIISGISKSSGRQVRISSPQKTSSTAMVDGWHGEGTYKIGTDIPAGEYYLEQTGDVGGYFEVCKDSKGVLDSIVAYDYFHGHTYITVSSGQYLKVERARFKLDTPS